MRSGTPVACDCRFDRIWSCGGFNESSSHSPVQRRACSLQRGEGSCLWSEVCYNLIGSTPTACIGRTTRDPANRATKVIARNQLVQINHNSVVSASEAWEFCVADQRHNLQTLCRLSFNLGSVLPFFILHSPRDTGEKALLFQCRSGRTLQIQALRAPATESGVTHTYSFILSTQWC